MFARLSALLLVTALLLGASPARVYGAPIFTVGPGGGNPGENLLFNNANLQLGPAATIQGVTNNSNRVLDITSTVNLVGNGGQARVEGQAGAFGGAGVTLAPHTANNLPGGLLPMGSFKDLKFNIDATADGPVAFSVVTNTGTFAFNSTLDDNGQNFFRFTTLGTEFINSVTITSSGNTIKKIEQIRLGGIVGPGQGPGPDPAPGSNPVPEPASLAVFGALLGIGALGARLRRKPAAA